MKKFNLAALPLAVAGVLASTSAFAGTEACFEVYKVADDAVVTAHGTLYTPASCIAVRGGATATDLAVIVNPTVAWELTGDVDLNLEALGTTPNTHIVYIPTTDVPPASRIQMQLTGADFGSDNANQIYLVHKDAGGNYQTVASSDGAFNDTDTVEFLTKAGITIGAGSRLLLSTTNPSGVVENGALVQGINLHIANTETCTINPSVSIRAISALTDAQTVIAGGVSSTGAVAVSGGSTSLVDISEQFALVADSDLTNSIEVDAEDPSFRTTFVNNAQSGGSWTGQVIPQKAFWATTFTNDKSLDMTIAIGAADQVTLALMTTSSTGADVTFGLRTDTATATDTDILLATAVTHESGAGGIGNVDFDGAGAVELPISTSGANYSIDADELFQDATSTNNVAATLTNVATKVMEFNYEVKTTWGLDFDNANYLDKVACESKTIYNVGVNGAVLKVPYVYTKLNEGGFVRITSEHDTEASIFMDIFDESSNETKNVSLGLIAAKSSNILKADDMLALAVADGYVGTGDRHTMTFTVTAPKNKVHGVSVQKIPGRSDRVIAVLDQNDWSQ